MSTTTRRPPVRRANGRSAGTTSGKSRRNAGTAKRPPGRSTGTAKRPPGRSTSSRSGARARVEVVQPGPTAESVVLGAVGILCLLGLVMVYSASSVASVQGGSSSWAVVSRQAVFMVLGVGAALLAARIPVQVWRDRIAVPLMFATMLVVSNRALLGNFVAPPGLRVMGWLATAVMVLAAVAMLVL